MRKSHLQRFARCSSSKTLLNMLYRILTIGREQSIFWLSRWNASSTFSYRKQASGLSGLQARINITSTDEPPFRMNFLHDLESLWWAAIWVLFHHTDANPPTEDPDGQLVYFDQALPCAIGQAFRHDFFTMSTIRRRRNHSLFSYSTIICWRVYTKRCRML